MGSEVHKKENGPKGNQLLQEFKEEPLSVVEMTSQKKGLRISPGRAQKNGHSKNDIESQIEEFQTKTKQVLDKSNRLNELSPLVTNIPEEIDLEIDRVIDLEENRTLLSALLKEKIPQKSGLI